MNKNQFDCNILPNNDQTLKSQILENYEENNNKCSSETQSIIIFSFYFIKF